MVVNLKPNQIELNTQEQEEVLRILKNHVPEHAVWAFGSRVSGGAKKYSDLDIVIITTEPLSLSKMADLNEAFDESNLVFKVDVVDWAITSDSFRRIIKTEKIVIQAGEII
jgi:predicted nucleotidyltransferase